MYFMLNDTAAHHPLMQMVKSRPVNTCPTNILEYFSADDFAQILNALILQIGEIYKHKINPFALIDFTRDIEKIFKNNNISSPSDQIVQYWYDTGIGFGYRTSMKEILKFSEYLEYIRKNGIDEDTLHVHFRDIFIGLPIILVIIFIGLIGACLIIDCIEGIISNHRLKTALSTVPKKITEIEQLANQLKVLRRDFEEFIPDEYLCPITKVLITDPVITRSGHTYDRYYIELHLSRSNTNPLTGETLENKTLIPNFILRNLTCGFLREVLQQENKKVSKEIIWSPFKDPANDLSHGKIYKGRVASQLTCY